LLRGATHVVQSKAKDAVYRTNPTHHLPKPRDLVHFSYTPRGIHNETNYQCLRAEKVRRTCVHALHVIDARKLHGQAAVSILMKRSLALQNKIVVLARDFNSILNEKMLN